MNKPVEKKRCAYRSPKTGQCIRTFPARGKKKFCSDDHRVRAFQANNETKPTQAQRIRQAAIERDGGCVMKAPCDCRNPKCRKAMFCKYDCTNPEFDIRTRRKPRYGGLVVRIVDPVKARTLENVQTLCLMHAAQVSERRFKARVGDEVYLVLKKGQYRHHMRMRAMYGKMKRVHKDLTKTDRFA